MGALETEDGDVAGSAPLLGAPGREDSFAAALTLTLFALFVLLTATKDLKGVEHAMEGSVCTGGVLLSCCVAAGRSRSVRRGAPGSIWGSINFVGLL